MANEFVAKNGLISQNNTTISGSLTVSASSGIPLQIKGGTGTLLSVSSSTSEIFKISDTFSPNLFTVSTGSIAVFNIDNTNAVKISGSLTVTGLTANRVIVTDANDQLISSATTATEIGYLSGVTSSIQPQFYSKAADVPKAWQTMGSTIKAQNLGYQAIPNITLSTALVNQQLRLQAVYLPQSQSITGVKWWQTANQSGHTPTNYNGVGLYTALNGTLSLAASSSNSSTIWTQGANRINSASFTTSYPASEGIYFVGILYSISAGTAPTFGHTANVVSTILLGLDFTNSEKINSLLGSQTTMPSSIAMSTTTGAQAAMWVGLF